MVALEQRTLSTIWIEEPERLWSLQDEWFDLANRTQAEIYLRPEWVRIWWNHFGTKHQLKCLIVRDGKRLTGLLPFCIEQIWAGPVPLRIARLAGTDPHCMIFQLPLEDEIANVALHEAISHLLDTLGCDAVSFTPVSDLAAHLPLLREIGQGTPGLGLHEAPEGGHVVFDLPGSFAQWIGGLSKKRRGQFQRDLANLQASYEMKRTTSVPDGVRFSAFAAFHDHQWQAQARGGHFTDWPGSLAFYRALADCPTKEPPIRLFELSGQTGPLATQFALVAGSMAHWRLPARTLDPEAERLSVGKVGLIMMIEELIGAGVRCIEAGRGDYGYKLSYGGRSVPVRRLLFYSSAKAGRLRLLLGWADLLHLLYYRIWFLRLTPWLSRWIGLQPQSLWRQWIRTRL